MTKYDTLVLRVCPYCGGALLGDGYTTVLHCEFAPEEEVELAKPDADPIWCNFDD